MNTATVGNTMDTPYLTARVPPTPAAKDPTPKLRKNEIPYPSPRDEEEVNWAIREFPMG